MDTGVADSRPPWDLYERTWAWYALTVSAAVLLFGVGRRGSEVFSPWSYVAIQAAVLAVILGLPLLVRDAAPRRAGRVVCALIGLPIVFSSLGLVLPDVHPEPYEWRWLEFDRLLFGADPTVELQAVLTPWSIEILQLCYASFYFIPMIVLVWIGLASGGRPFDRALEFILFAFFLSYLGYFLWPTLPPYRFLHHEHALEGIWLAQGLYEIIDSSEANRWDCFPSGHTMLSVLSLFPAWRYTRRLFWWLLPVVILLVFSTVALRYHYVTDVLAGLIGVPLVLWLWGRITSTGRRCPPPAVLPAGP